MQGKFYWQGIVVGALFFYLVTYYLGEPRYIGFLAGQKPFVIGITALAALVWGLWWGKLVGRKEKIAAAIGAVIGTWFSPAFSAVSVRLTALHFLFNEFLPDQRGLVFTLVIDILGLIVAICFAFIISWIFKWVAQKI